MKIRDVYFILALVLVIVGTFTDQVELVLAGVFIALVEAYDDYRRDESEEGTE